VATIARETGWSYHAILWEVPLSVCHQICDVILMERGADLRWRESDVDIDKLLNG
jgi:hypothetical protein